MIKERLTELLRKKFPGLESGQAFSRQMNSLQVIELVKEIETHFGIEIQSMEIDDENFQSVASMEALIQQKLNRLNAGV